jgi:cation transport ATPase
MADSYNLHDYNNTDSVAKAWVQKLDKFNNEKDYLNAQKALPENERDGAFTRQAVRQYFKQKERKEKGEEGLDERFQHNYPKMMFVLLPLFALYLKWFYRRSKKWFYADHAIFSLHFHTFFFIFYLFTTILDWLFNVDFISLVGLIVIFIYLILSLKRIYGGKPFWKALWLVILYSFTLLVVFTVFSIIISFLT